MAVSSNLGFINDTQDNYANAQLKSLLLDTPINIPATVQSNIPWKYEKIEILDSYVYKTNNVIRFTLPRNGLIDPRSVRFSFQVRALKTPTVAAAAGFNFDINSVFSRCEIKCGRHSSLIDMQQYNVFSRMISSMATEYQTVLNPRAAMLGVGRYTPFGQNIAAGRTYYHSHTQSTSLQPLGITRRYMVNINAGLFSQQKPIYLDGFNDDLVIEFTIEDPRNCVYFMHVIATNNLTPQVLTGVSVEISNPTLHYTRYMPSPTLYKDISTRVMNGTFAYQYNNYECFKFPIKARTIKHTFTIPVSRKWLKYAVAVIRCDRDREQNQFSALRTYASIDPNTNALLTSNVPRAYRYHKQSAIKQYQWRYVNQYIPEQPVRVLNTNPVFYNPNGTEVAALPVDFEGPQYTDTLKYNFAGPAVEAWYMVEQLFLKHKELNLQHASDGFPVPMDQGSPYWPMICIPEDGVFNSFLNVGDSTAGDQIGRNQGNLMMVGNFSECDYEGKSLALSGGLENEGLQFEFECNGVSDNPTPENDMFLEVFVAYDNILQLMPTGVKLTN